MSLWQLVPFFIPVANRKAMCYANQNNVPGADNMNQNLRAAADTLAQGGYTCVLCRENVLLTNSRRGIRPLLELLESGRDLHGFSAADKVVGKAAAFLYRLMGIEAVYAAVISRPAAEILANSGIRLHYGKMVPEIRNRTGDGLCPMEAAVQNIADPTAALQAIKDTLSSL